MKIIAKIYTDFKEKFGIPRQSGIVEEAVGKIVFEKPYRNPDAVRGLDGYSHIWLIWGFSECQRDDWSPTVRPPRLGGNRRMGVFATRAPYRPNPIGLSSVRLLKVECTEDGPIIYVSGMDMLNGTPIYDIKPYLPYTDSHPDAREGFAKEVKDYALNVEIPECEIKKISREQAKMLHAILAHDPRPSYQNDNTRIYGFNFADFEVLFTVEDNLLTVKEIRPNKA